MTLTLKCERCQAISGVKLNHAGRFLCAACMDSQSVMGVEQARKSVDSLKAEVEELNTVVNEMVSSSLLVKNAMSQAKKQLGPIEELTSALAAARAELEKAVIPVVIKHADGGAHRIPGYTHMKVQMLAELVTNKIDCYLWGPAGAGKNMACEQVANAAGLDYRVLQLSALSLRSELVGYVNPITGARVETTFTSAYQNGGLFLADELDNWPPSVVASINSALANGYAALPWGEVPRHKDFVFVGAGNTDGQGGTIHYGERRALSGATRDRLVSLYWPIDSKLELALVSNGDGLALSFAVLVQKCRQAATEAGDRLLITPRATLQGVRLLAMGWSRMEVVRATVLRGSLAIPTYLVSLIDNWVAGNGQ